MIRQSVYLSVCVLVTTASPTKTDETIEMPSAEHIGVGATNHVIDGAAHSRHLANTTARSVELMRCGLLLQLL